MMRPEEWRQIEQLYHAALERPPEERSTFLDTVCAGDQPLRQEVESLLAYDEQARPFIETPPGDIAAGVLAEEQARSVAGRTLGHYRMLSPLGAGGGGEVYLAEDTQLGRKVALKLLLAQFIYEIGEVGETHFIAAEFVEGSTLRQRMASERLEMQEALEAAIQIASALDAAHKAGIVHRDIKPENIMVRPDGLIKVLDFGLAKLTESQAPTVDAQATTVAGNSTETGLVMGTPRYMSPEQVRGQKADARTDIFSLGVVLYEMIAGSAPFKGGTRSDVMAAILKSDPLPLTCHWPDVPREVEQIVEKALRKDREKRYQVIKDLQLDLTDLKEKLEFEARLESTYQPGARDRATINTRDRPTRVNTAPGPVVRTLRGAITPSRIAYLIGIMKRHQRGALLTLSALVVIVAGLILGWRPWISQRRQSVSFQAGKITRLTHTGKAVSAAISPDGKYVAYVKDEAGLQSLWLIQVATTSDTQIVPPAEVNYRGITADHDWRAKG